jgi:xanthine dehydrogenase accessory factor
MNENEYLARTVNEHLEAGSPLVLVSIMSMEGSTPRHSGTKMVVGADGNTIGTIGGSLIEAAAIRESKDVLSKAKSRILSYELTGKDATAPGMICGGKAEILLDYIPATEENQIFSRYWLDMARRGKDFHFITHLKGAGSNLQVLRHAIIYSDGIIIGNGSVAEPEIESLKPELHNISSTSVLNFEDTWVMVDRIRKLKTVYCFGAGHVAVPTAHLAALTGFCVVVIVTRGHQYDRAVLEQSLKTKAGYIGMISSRRKREAIYKELTANGVDIEQLEKVHSPIGIDIGGETPEEIAVSIVAELIKVRRQQSV